MVAHIYVQHEYTCSQARRQAQVSQWMDRGTLTYRRMTWLTARDLFPVPFRRPQGGNALPRILQSTFDVTRRSATGNVVQSEHLGESEAGVEARVKARVDRLQIGERKFL